MRVRGRSPTLVTKTGLVEDDLGQVAGDQLHGGDVEDQLLDGGWRGAVARLAELELGAASGALQGVMESTKVRLFLR